MTNKKTLFMPVGLPRSGKSTWCRSTKYPIVSPDAIRLALHGQPYIQQAEPAVWSMARYMVSSLFLAGHSNVILDATNITVKRREVWESEDWDRHFVVIPTPLNTCLERAKATGFPADIILQMAEDREPPTEAEGRITTIR